jgi:methionyl-tRNA synthetase
MPSSNNFYLTTTLPYVNAAPHIGFALEIVEADVIARYQREIAQKNVVFNTGTDEHGQKIWEKAIEQSLEPQAYCDQWAAKFSELKEMLNLSFDHFIRTTDAKHVAAAQEFWRRCKSNGDIYKAKYQVKYCVGCEMAKTESELVEGRCPLHPKQEIELREEENYFFRFSKYQDKLLELYENNPDFVKPAHRLREIQSFVAAGLEDFSISRLKSKMPWGIAVPGDEEHVMYVWFDALVNYISTLDWPQDQAKFEQFWPGVQLAGKDNLRQQSAMWQAMLLSAQLPPSKQILINGFIGVDGQKMSKSLGNVISPSELVARYGLDASRYLLIDLGTFGEDMDASFGKFDINYNAALANGLGNLCSRVAKMASQVNLNSAATTPDLPPIYLSLMDNYQLNEALAYVLEQISQADKFLAEHKPWQQEAEAKNTSLQEAVKKIQIIASMLAPFMPSTAATIREQFSGRVQAFETGLFPRIEIKNTK